MTKSKLQVKEVNCETGEEILRDATAEEIAQMKIDADNYAEQKIADQAKEIQRQEILARIGITADEAQLLLG